MKIFSILSERRELVANLVSRELKSKYKGSALGFLWSILTPLFMAAIYVFFLRLLAGRGVSVENIIIGVFAWQFTSLCVTGGMMCVSGNSNLVKKVYFPRLIIPLSKSISALMDLLIVMIILAGMIIFYQIPLSWQSLMFLPFILMAILAGIAFGIWVSALSIRFRDFTHILPLVLRIGMFLSPIAYGATLVPHTYKWAFNLNPLTGIIEGCRWALFNTPLDVGSIWMSMVVILVVLLGGVWYFLRMDQYIADVI